MVTNPIYSSLTLSGKNALEKPSVPAKPINYQEYYLKYGFLPHSFSTVVDGKEVIGGCARWRAWADSKGYPRPMSQKQIDAIYRPWL